MNNSEVCSGVIISGFIGVLLININIFAVFCWSLVSGCHICFNLRRGALAASSSLSSSVGSSVGSSVSSLVSSLVSSSLLGSSSSGYRYSFTIVVLKSVGPLGNCTLHVSLLIPSNLNKPVHLPLCPVLPSCYMSTSKLRGRLWIVVTDRPFHWFNALLTCFLALILAISSIAFFITAVCYIINGANGLNSFI